MSTGLQSNVEPFQKSVLGPEGSWVSILNVITPQLCQTGVLQTTTGYKSQTPNPMRCGVLGVSRTKDSQQVEGLWVSVITTIINISVMIAAVKIKNRYYDQSCTYK